MPSYTIQQIADCVGGTVNGPGNLEITGVEQLDRAATGQLTFIGSQEYAQRWPDSGASAALIQLNLNAETGANRALVRVENVDLAMAAVLELYAPPLPAPPPGIHERAMVDPSAVLGKGVAIGALSFVGARVRIGAGTVVHPNVTILHDTVIGEGCVLWPGVVIRDRCEIGDGCILHPNVTIGADGFGYRPAADGRSLVKIPHIGTVRLGRDVEIGAGTCVDRGKFSATEIGDGTKIDNLCQIAHNCRIGRGVIIVSKCGFGGSCTVGDGAMFGGGSILKDHVTVGPGARLGGCSAAMNDIPAGESWHGHPAHNATATFREFAAIRKLPEMLRTIKQLEKQQAKAAD